MLHQTVDNLLPLLSVLQQPAFCLHDNGTVSCNPAAQTLAPAQAEQLPHWLGSCAQTYAHWGRTGSLELTVQLHEQTYTVTIHPLQDGTLFLLTAHASNAAVDAALAVASQVLRQPLTDLTVLTQRISEQADPAKLADATAAMTRQLHHMARLTGNLADLVSLHNGTYRLRLELKDLTAGLMPLMMELEDLCKTIDRPFQWQLPDTPLLQQADYALLERAILNLISNAIKYGTKGSPICFRAEEQSGYTLLQVQNQCSQERPELLRAVFSRLERRNQLPDPRWGIGLGLPIVQSIAQLHGGMAAVEAEPDGTVTVTMSISRKRPLKPPVLAASSIPFEYSGGMRRSLMELAEVLPNSIFQKDAL